MHHIVRLGNPLRMFMEFSSQEMAVPFLDPTIVYAVLESQV
jgi:hypothetical protein